MIRETVKSSNLKFVGYSPEKQILEIEFHNGSVYQYEDVSKNTYQALLDAPSKGKYFNESIKGKFKFSKIKGNLKCFYGDDGFLQYWYECLDCGSVLVVDYSDKRSVEPWSCPVCNKPENFPFKYYTKKEIEECEAIKKLIEMYKEVWDG